MISPKYFKRSKTYPEAFLNNNYIDKLFNILNDGFSKEFISRLFSEKRRYSSLNFRILPLVRELWDRLDRDEHSLIRSITESVIIAFFVEKFGDGNGNGNLNSAQKVMNDIMSNVNRELSSNVSLNISIRQISDPISEDTALRKLKREYDKINKEYNKLINENIELKKSNEKLTQQVQSLSSENQNLKRSLGGLKKYVGELRGELNSIVNTLKTVTKMLSEGDVHSSIGIINQLIDEAFKLVVRDISIVDSDNQKSKNIPVFNASQSFKKPLKKITETESLSQSEDALEIYEEEEQEAEETEQEWENEVDHTLEENVLDTLEETPDEHESDEYEKLDADTSNLTSDFRGRIGKIQIRSDEVNNNSFMKPTNDASRENTLLMSNVSRCHHKINPTPSPPVSNDMKKVDFSVGGGESTPLRNVFQASEDDNEKIKTPSTTMSDNNTMNTRESTSTFSHSEVPKDGGEVKNAPPKRVDEYTLPVENKSEPSESSDSLDSKARRFLEQLIKDSCISPEELDRKRRLLNYKPRFLASDKPPHVIASLRETYLRELLKELIAYAVFKKTLKDLRELKIDRIELERRLRAIKILIDGHPRPTEDGFGKRTAQDIINGVFKELKKINRHFDEKSRNERFEKSKNSIISGIQHALRFFSYHIVFNFVPFEKDIMDIMTSEKLKSIDAKMLFVLFYDRNNNNLYEEGICYKEEIDYIWKLVGSVDAIFEL